MCKLSFLRYGAHKVICRSLLIPIIFGPNHRKRYYSGTQCDTPTSVSKYEIFSSFYFWDFVFKMFSILTPVDYKWPFVSKPQCGTPTYKYDICASFPSWDIVCTSKATQTHIHTNAIVITKVTNIIETHKEKIEREICFCPVPNTPIYHLIFRSRYPACKLHFLVTIRNDIPDVKTTHLTSKRAK